MLIYERVRDCVSAAGNFSIDSRYAILPLYAIGTLLTNVRATRDPTIRQKQNPVRWNAAVLAIGAAHMNVCVCPHWSVNHFVEFTSNACILAGESYHTIERECRLKKLAAKILVAYDGRIGCAIVETIGEFDCSASVHIVRTIFILYILLYICICIYIKIHILTRIAQFVLWDACVHCVHCTSQHQELLCYVSNCGPRFVSRTCFHRCDPSSSSSSSSYSCE